MNLKIDLNKEISIGLVSEKPDLKGMRSKRESSQEFAGEENGGRSGGNGGGGMGGGRAPMGGGRPGGITNSETNLDLWIKVKLVANN